MNNDLQPLGNVGASEQTADVSVSQSSQPNQQPAPEGRLDAILKMLRGTTKSSEPQPSSSQPSVLQSLANPSPLEFTSSASSTYQPIETPPPVANATFATPSLSPPSPAETTASSTAANFTNETLTTAAFTSPITTEASAGSLAENFSTAPINSQPIANAVDMSTITQVGDASQISSKEVSEAVPATTEPNLKVLGGTDSDLQNQPNMSSFEAPPLTPGENEKAKTILGMLTDPDNQAVLAKLAKQLSS